MRETEFLAQFLTQERKDLIERVLKNRTKMLTVVLEDVFQPHNASAVIRTMDCLGVQDLHVLEPKNKFSPNADVAMGANKWVDIHHYRDKTAVEHCYANLRLQGYKIVATTLSEGAVDFSALNFAEKHAFVFGTEETGLSSQAVENADFCLKLPMFGFTQSYNVSVSVALTLFALTQELRKEQNNWQLTPTQYEKLKLKWYKNSIKNADIYLQRMSANEA